MFEQQAHEVMSTMSAPIQRAFHSSQPEGQGNVNAPVDHFDAQRDLWEFLLPLRHLQATSLYGSGVLTGLEVSGTLNSIGLRVTPGLALDPGGRPLPVTVSSDAEDLRVRLQRPSEGGSTLEGLAPVNQDGVMLDTQGQGGERFVVLEWSETRIRADERTFYRLTPWLRLEPVAADPTRRWVVLARVVLGTGAEQGLVKRLDAGPRLGMASLRDGLVLTRPMAEPTGSGASRGMAIFQTPVAALRARSDDVLDVAFWDRSEEEWRTALSVDGTSGKVGIGVDAAETSSKLEVEGDIRATSVSAEEVFVRELIAAQVTVEAMRLPIIRAGRTDPATTPWQQNNVNELFLRVDTSSAGFTQTPLYFSSLHGAGGQQVVTGTSSFANPTPTSFDLFIRTPTLDPVTWTLTVGFARDRQWFINWVGILPR